MHQKATRLKELALFLSQKYDVYLFEKNNSLGGHTRTITVKSNDTYYDIDTGFIKNINSKSDPIL